MPEDAPEHVDTDTGDVTDISFATARARLSRDRAVDRGALFIFAAWLPALAQVATGHAKWTHVSATFGRRLRRLRLAAVVVGLVATAMAIVLEAAAAAGVSFWSAPDADVIDSVSETRPVQAWTLRIVVWLVLGVSLLAASHDAERAAVAALSSP